MRIAVDAWVLGLPELRGIGNYLSQILAAWPDERDTFHFLSPGPIDAARLPGPGGREVLIVPQRRGCRFHVWRWWSLPRALRRLGPDLLWSPANLAAPAGFLPQAVTIHDTLLQEHVRHDSLTERVFHGLVSPWWVRRHATRVIAVSEFTKRRIIDVFGCASDRVRVILNGASEPGGAFADKDQARAYLRGKGLADGTYVLALGAESPWKNTEGALRAFALVSRTNRNVDFIVAGTQPRARRRFEDLGRALGLGSRLRMPGFVDQRELTALYQGAEVFVYPSLFEGFGLPVLEAMALGTPVVASDAAAIPEVADQAALMTDAADPDSLAHAVLNVLGSPKLGGQLAAAGRDNIRRFRWDLSAKSHRDLFRECLDA